MPLKRISRELLFKKIEKFTKEKYTATREVIDSKERTKRVQELLNPKLNKNIKKANEFLDNLKLHKELKENNKEYEKLEKQLFSKKETTTESLKIESKMFNLLSEQEVIIQKSMLTKFNSKELNELHEKLVKNLDYFLFKLNKEKQEKKTLKNLNKKADFKEFEYDFLVKYSNLLESEKTVKDAVELTNYFLEIIKEEIKSNIIGIN